MTSKVAWKQSPVSPTWVWKCLESLGNMMKYAVTAWKNMGQACITPKFPAWHGLLKGCNWPPSVFPLYPHQQSRHHMGNFSEYKHFAMSSWQRGLSGDGKIEGPVSICHHVSPLIYVVVVQVVNWGCPLHELTIWDGELVTPQPTRVKPPNTFGWVAMFSLIVNSPLKPSWSSCVLWGLEMGGYLKPPWFGGNLLENTGTGTEHNPL